MAEKLTAELYSADGKVQGTIDLNPDIFGIEPNVPVMHQVVTAQLAAARAGSHSTKTRSEVRGGGRKPWRQKGLGRARHGSIRSPQWAGGGVAHGPKPRDYSQRTPKKMKRLALRSALNLPHTLEDLGVSNPDVERLAALALEDPSAAGNPVRLTRDATVALLDNALRGRLR